MVRTGYTEESEERFWFDIISAVVLFMTAIGGAWLPKYLCSPEAHITSSQSLAFHLGNMLSAGVMLSAGFCHLLADAHRNLLFMGRFPISNFLAATGYIITLLADQVVQFVGEHAADASPGGAKVDTSGSGGGGGSGIPLFWNVGYKQLPSTGTELAVLASASGGEPDDPGGAKVVCGQEGVLTTLVHRGEGHGSHHNGHAHTHTHGLIHHGGKAGGRDPEIAAAAGTPANGSAAGSHGGAADDGGKAPLLPVSSSLGRSRSHSAGGAGGAGASGDCHSAGMAVLLGGGRKLSFATAVLLASALCIHSILEGMALGAQQSMRSTEDIMVAIAAHKGLAAYALGASIMESGASSKRFWTVIGCFSLATPIGIFAGYGMSSAASSKSGSALSALASGTFLYVAFMEVIPKELADGKHRAAKMAAFLMGYGLMSLLAVWA